MRLIVSIAVGAVLVATGACAPGRDDAVDVHASAPRQAAPGDVPTGAAGKISADQVGKVSPVPAFRGGGRDWSVEISSLGDMRHSVRLVSGNDVHEGTVVYQPSADAQSQILLTGALQAPPGDAVRILLTRGECHDAAGRTHRHRVNIDVARATPLQGCGDLAMY